jgi:hypothetical protein
MSAKLLMSPEPLLHTLADDLESFLHVLNWVALRYMCHGLTADALTKMLRDMYDYSWHNRDGTSVGGDYKENFLSKSKILQVELEDQNIHTLLGELTTTMAFCYARQPLEEERTEYLQTQEPKNLSNSLLQGMARQSFAGQYIHAENALNSHEWMLDTFSKALTDRDKWFPHVLSKENPIIKETTRGRKRKSSLDHRSDRKNKCRYSNGQRARTTSSGQRIIAI